MDKIKEIAPEHIYIIGGTAAVSEETFKQAEKLCNPGFVKRLYGRTRYTTSIAVAAYFDKDGLAISAVIAYGGDFPDGLTGGAFAASINAPVILVDDNNYNAAEGYLDYGDMEYIYVMGGTSVISDETISHLIK